MMFLVLGEYIDPGALVPPDQALNVVEQVVVPSFQMFAQLAQQGKLKGGIYPGERAGGFVIDVESYEELDSIMNHSPFFGLVKWTVKPLMPYEAIARQLPEYLRDARQMLQGVPRGRRRPHRDEERSSGQPLQSSGRPVDRRLIREVQRAIWSFLDVELACRRTGAHACMR